MNTITIEMTLNVPISMTFLNGKFRCSKTCKYTHFTIVSMLEDFFTKTILFPFFAGI
jgi:hypothetical protein